MVDSNLVFGLDLGTTYCCAYLFNTQKNEPELVTNECGKTTTPSFTSFTRNDKGEDMMIVGTAAKSKQVTQCESCIYDVKRFIGMTYSEFQINKELKLDDFTFKIL